MGFSFFQAASQPGGQRHSIRASRGASVGFDSSRLPVLRRSGHATGNTGLHGGHQRGTQRVASCRASAATATVPSGQGAWRRAGGGRPASQPDTMPSPPASPRQRPRSPRTGVPPCGQRKRRAASIAAASGPRARGPARDSAAAAGASASRPSSSRARGRDRIVGSTLRRRPSARNDGPAESPCMSGNHSLHPRAQAPLLRVSRWLQGLFRIRRGAALRGGGYFRSGRRPASAAIRPPPSASAAPAARRRSRRRSRPRHGWPRRWRRVGPWGRCRPPPAPDRAWRASPGAGPA
jgi:hypothetical protein